eukprot:TRINITY_DN3634_c0_g1_i1.p1 TRINITY_DN3634_c0_g1~~TRINITY_DN3634_c0_g1_i1.p1  ORF type:complete len:406 (+),score=68.39 TRINITY_DN3634_c0_g1_i1:88-1305(+)
MLELRLPPAALPAQSFLASTFQRAAVATLVTVLVLPVFVISVAAQAAAVLVSANWLIYPTAVISVIYSMLLIILNNRRLPTGLHLTLIIVQIAFAVMYGVVPYSTFSIVAASIVSFIAMFCCLHLSFMVAFQPTRVALICSTQPSPNRNVRVTVQLASPEIVSQENSSYEESDNFKFFCPICMLFYASAFKAKCCDNQICNDCTVSLLRGHHLAERITLLPPPYSYPLNCPYCRTETLHLEKTQHSEKGRRYEDSPAVKDALSRARARAFEPSPLRAGDNFDKLKSKLVSFVAPQPPVEQPSQRCDGIAPTRLFTQPDSENAPPVRSTLSHSHGVQPLKVPPVLHAQTLLPPVAPKRRPALQSLSEHEAAHRANSVALADQEVLPNCVTLPASLVVNPVALDATS